MKTIKLTADTKWNIVLTIIFLAFAGSGVLVSIKFHLIMGLFVTLIFVLVTILNTTLYKSSEEPQLIIDDEGVHDLRWGAGFIPWGDIRDGCVKSQSVPGYFISIPTLCIYLHDPDSYLEHFKRTGRSIWKWRGFNAYGDIPLSLYGLKGAAKEEIDAAVRERIAAREEA